MDQETREFNPDFEKTLYLLDKHYLLDESYEIAVAESEEFNFNTSVRFLHLIKFVYEKDKKITDKLASVYSSLYSEKATVILKLISDGVRCDLFLGIKRKDDAAKSLKVLQGSLEGNFPGTTFSKRLSNKQIRELNGTLFKGVEEITCTIGVPALKSKEDDHFLQGIENLIIGMQGKKFSAIFLADPINSEDIEGAKSFYENIYSQLSPLKEQVLNQTTNESIAYTKGITHSVGNTFSVNHSETSSYSMAQGESISSNDTEQPWLGKRILNLGVGSGSVMNKVLHSPVDVINFGVNRIVGGAGGETINSGESALYFHDENGRNISKTLRKRTGNFDLVGTGGKQVTKGKTTTTTHTSSKTTGASRSNSENRSHNVSGSQTAGSSSSRQSTQENKFILNQLHKMDIQFERLNKGGGIGMWNVGAYFLSEEQQNSVVAANIYSGLLKGEGTHVEKSVIRTYALPETEDFKNLIRHLRVYEIPKIVLPQISFYNTLSSVVNTDEMVMQFSLPQKSVVGLDVVEVAPFGNNLEIISSDRSLKIGKLYNFEKEFDVDFELDYKKFTGHIFVTGSTGSGKSNVTYNLLQKLIYRGIKFLVIEPAKGEYKDVFGNREDVNVFGTNPRITKLLKINPFSFPSEIHIHEHIDRLLEILNSSWPMYAAMPAILKEGIERAYIKKGWDLKNSINYLDDTAFPTFRDLAEILPEIISNSSFSQEMMSNYTGALVTRVNSMTNGLTDLVFGENEVSNKKLFDENTIVDLSRVASAETRSLLMGVLFMKLQEYRMAKATEANTDLKHVAIIEEAHNLLKRTNEEQTQEGANLQGKAVEMISNAIAEMRTYGQGFILADQAPGLLDPSVIRNTNTKICLRLPSQEDRELIGKAMNLNEDQINQLAKLKTGVAAVYQNDWQEAMLCKFDLFEQKIGSFNYRSKLEQQDNIRKFLAKQLVAVFLEKTLEKELLEKCLKYDGFHRIAANVLSGTYSENQIAKELFYLLRVETLLEIIEANHRSINTPTRWVSLYMKLMQKKWNFESNSCTFIEIINLTLKYLSGQDPIYLKAFNSFSITNQLKQIK